MLEIIIVNGIICGGVYSLLALGFSLVFGVARIFNMAHTAFYMVAAYIMYYVNVELGCNPLVAAILAIIIPVITAIVYYKYIINRVKRHELPVVVVTIALAIVFQEILLMVFGGQNRGIDPFIGGFIDIVGVSISYQQLVVILVCLVANMGVWALLSKTKLGNAIKAVSQDMEIAGLMGINPDMVCVITMGISVALGAIAGIIITPITLIEPLMWSSSIVVIMAVVVLGGLGSIKGSIIGAFLLGFAETIVVTLVPMGAFLRGVLSLVVMIVVLWVKPEGLFGAVFEEERL